MQKTKYLAVFATTTLIFLIGILVGNYFASQKLNKVDEIEQKLKIDTLGTELQFMLISEDPCGFVNSTSLTEEIHELGVKLDYMENILGKDDNSVLNLKEYYWILELRQWVLEKQINEICNQTNTLILYFYSNDEEQCGQCEEQGYILTYLRKNYEDLNIYSFDIDAENPAVKTIKEMYAVTETPTVIINDQKMGGFASKDLLVAALENHTASYAEENKALEDVTSIERLE